ncbi:YueI family protein [Lactobacillus sp. ESL0684]|uniref:YueI family protein n=1 Tax=unclassified Lactobacillus TaxID=2620435 RepID=UPI0023F95B49|nr:MULTISPECIES: YueI family protein [unclassified Lactobacillus]WEV40566.1 YueI family protein [Lactobacillus sp. ESL0681]WEV42911.1 YueI family protein [Lactobacillus sp. ESL0684]
MTEDLNTRVEHAAQGITPQTKPDERRRFLGSLRERVLVRMNNTEVTDPKLTSLFLNHFADYQGYSILINGNLDDNFLNQVEAQCGRYEVPFTLVNNETARTGSEDTAILVVAKTAINKPRIEVNQVYSPELPKDQLSSSQPKKKSGFWHRLFHGDN